MAADAYKKALARQAKFNPYHDEAGRFTNVEGAVQPGAGRDGRVRVAQAGGGRPTYRSSLLARFPHATPAQQARFEIAAAAARSATAEVAARDGTWRRLASLRDPDSIEGAIAAAEHELVAAEARLRAIEAEPFSVLPARVARAPQTMSDVCLPGGRLAGARRGSAGNDVMTLSPAKFDRLVRDLRAGAIEMVSRPGYNGVQFRRQENTVFGARISEKHGLTVDIIDSGGNPDLPRGTRFHYGY